ncbi:UNKNOWN [Stylonychia lemnae]|uniref:Uncharacterized protein n=1 Tax=Stylonychia lemnae TaxID=5949 RepID=A0A078B728_STYLE|nr:UNKNOWN [Stylonychia lemnae]|eukprot:CDW89107.1 UNKNOWN [Stylonychia lemnae]
MDMPFDKMFQGKNHSRKLTIDLKSNRTTTAASATRTNEKFNSSLQSKLNQDFNQTNTTHRTIDQKQYQNQTNEKQNQQSDKKPQNQNAQKTQSNQVIMNGFLVTFDEKTGQYQMKKLEDKNQKKELRDRYFFHYQNWNTKKKQQLSLSMRAGHKPGKMSYGSLNWMADNQQFPEYNEIEVQNKVLKKHVDGEIFIPRTLIDPGILQAQSKLKQEQLFQQQLKSKKHTNEEVYLPLPNESQESKINKNLFQIEKRLGLSKPNKLSILQQMINRNQTNNNIQLLESEILKKKSEKQASDDSIQQNKDIMYGSFSGQNSQYIKIKDFQDNSQIVSTERKKQAQTSYLSKRVMSQDREKTQGHLAQSSIANDKNNLNYLSNSSINHENSQQGLEQNSKNQNSLIISLNETPIQHYQNAEIEANQVSLKIPRNVFSHQSYRTGRNLFSDKHADSSTTQSKCHGIRKSQFFSPKQKLIEKMFENQKDDYSQKESISQNIRILDQESENYNSQRNTLYGELNLSSPNSEYLPKSDYRYLSPVQMQQEFSFDRQREETIVDQVLQEINQTLKEKELKKKRQERKKNKVRRSQKISQDDLLGNSILNSDASESMDDEKLLKAGKKGFTGGKFDLYNKYLNILLLRSGDPYVSQMFSKYLQFKRKGKRDQKQKNFYERMQNDIIKRKVEEFQKFNEPKKFLNQPSNLQSLDISRDSTAARFQKKPTLKFKRRKSMTEENVKMMDNQVVNEDELNLQQIKIDDQFKFQKRKTINFSNKGFFKGITMRFDAQPKKKGIDDLLQTKFDEMIIEEDLDSN